MSSLTKITLSIAGTEKIMERLDMVQQKVDNLASRIENVEKKFTGIEKSQDYQAEKIHNHQSDIAKILTETKNYKTENTIINKALNEPHDKLELEKNKRNQLEQYGIREMLEFSGIPQV